MRKLLLIMFVMGLSLFGHGQAKRFEKMFQDLERKGDSIWKIEEERISKEFFEQSWQIIMEMNDDSITIPKKGILLMCWGSYIDGSCSFREKGDFDSRSLVNQVKARKAELELYIRQEKFWKDYYSNKRWRRRK